jgi:ribonuclease P protein component
VTNETSAIPRKPKAISGAERTFPKAARILRSAEFRHIYENGFRVSGPLFAAFCLQRPEAEASGPRLGLTVPRAVGRAVERNRIKRRLREAFRLHRAELGPRWDLVLNPRRAMLTAEFPQIEQALGAILKKCNSRS